MSPSEFETLLTEKLPTDLFRMLKKLEIDISKFDKSQGKLILLIEIEIYVLLGMPRYLAKLWFLAHEKTTLVDRLNKIKAWVDYQRKSGDASTFFGNTIVLMIVLAIIFNMHDVLLAILAGDDSLILSRKDFSKFIELLSSLFNLEAKVLDFKYPYFCSKFLLTVGDRYYYVPDPLKLVSKLGRKDLKNYDHVEEYRKSLLDLTQVYDNAVINEQLSAAVYERYGAFPNITMVISAIRTVVADKKFFL